MADTLESLEIEVKHSASGAADEITKVASAVRKLNRALEKTLPNFKLYRDMMGQTPVTYNDNRTAQIADTINNTKQAASAAGKATKQAAKGVKDLSQQASRSKGPLENLISSLKRIAFYRMIRAVIKAITQAFQEGLEQAYLFSSTLSTEGVRFSQSIDRMKSAGNQMKGQLGAAFAALLAAVEPILIAIINLITRAADAISQLLSAFTGKTYLKAGQAAAGMADSMGDGAKAAKEWRNQLLGFDEINRLEAPSDSNSGSGGGGGGSGYVFTDVPINEKYLRLVEKFTELASRMKFNIRDVLFNWSNLDPENIAKKAIAGLSGILGGAVGFMIGGVPGAVVGTILGVTVGLLIDSLIFNKDRVLGKSELGNMLSLAITALAGGLIGFAVGGPGGALLGATIGVGVFAALKGVDFFADGKFSTIISQLATALTIFAGAAIGFMVGGPAGAVIGATIGVGIAATIEELKFNVAENPERAKYRSGLDWFIVGVLGLPSDEEWKQWGKNVIQWIGDGFKDFGHELYLIFVAPFEDMIDSIKDMLGIGGGGGTSAEFSNIGGSVVQGLWDGVSARWSEFIGFFQGLWNKLASWWSSLSLSPFNIPHPHFDWTYSEATGLIAKAMEFVGIPPTIPHLQISWYAQGGFPDTGSLYFASENGPELVGTMGNRNAVANNDQIIEGIRQGVYDAVSAAMASGGNGNVNVKVFLDSREIKTGQQRLNRAMGVS